MEYGRRGWTLLCAGGEEKTSQHHCLICPSSADSGYEKKKYECEKVGKAVLTQKGEDEAVLTHEGVGTELPPTQEGTGTKLPPHRGRG